MLSGMPFHSLLSMCEHSIVAEKKQLSKMATGCQTCPQPFLDRLLLLGLTKAFPPFLAYTPVPSPGLPTGVSVSLSEVGLWKPCE